ncbi:UNVERIFIED_CONTAM: hypothetical protein Sradi_4746200 [Sesamum radiatum]|uniref:Uncharacterized protein n=1 Tax=Sesamum radiatum TaxID=300843 RepID=A0AAW2MWJ9_SESRA
MRGVYVQKRYANKETEKLMVLHEEAYKCLARSSISRPGAVCSRDGDCAIKLVHTKIQPRQLR